MKIALITTEALLEENARIAEEVVALGHKFTLYDFKEFEYGVLDNKLKVEGFTDELPDIIIIRGVFRSIKAITAFIQGLREKGVKVYDNNFLTHKYSINKIADLIKLVDKDIPVPDSFHLHDFNKYFTAAKKIGFPIIVKLTRTGKGAGVYKVNSEDELSNFISDLENLGIKAKTYLIQKYIPYKFDLRILIIGDKIFCMRRVPREGEFRANFSLGGSVEPYELDEEGKKLAIRALKAVDIKIGGVDMLITEDNKRYILEVNHTPGMIGMEKATNQNITKEFVEYAIANAK